MKRAKREPDPLGPLWEAAGFPADIRRWSARDFQRYGSLPQVAWWPTPAPPPRPRRPRPASGSKAWGRWMRSRKGWKHLRARLEDEGMNITCYMSELGSKGGRLRWARRYPHVGWQRYGIGERPPNAKGPMVTPD